MGEQNSRVKSITSGVTCLRSFLLRIHVRFFSGLFLPICSMTCSQEAFLLNITSVLLLFCKPFLSRDQAKVNFINQYYCLFTKLVNYDKFSKLCEAESEEIKLPGLTDDLMAGKFQYVLLWH